MKKLLLKFADSLVSKDQMKAIKGGVVYCYCSGPGQVGFVGFPDTQNPNNYNCAYRCANG